jgi:4-hydroxybenzoate polyprenyltransferase
MIERVRTYLSFVRFSHSVFALPFALAGALLASRHTPITWPVVGWILARHGCARSAAMGFNRLVDARLDALNPGQPVAKFPAAR